MRTNSAGTPWIAVCTGIAHVRPGGALFVLLLLAMCSQSVANPSSITPPPGSVAFGTSVTILSNGNLVVTDPEANSARGAVHLFSPSRQLISSLVGSTAGDRVGDGGIIVLANGNYVVRSTIWQNAVAARAGAVTWGSKNLGVSGAVSAANSLVGTADDDSIGTTVTPLSNGSYVVTSVTWGDDDLGAVTWGNGNTGVKGTISISNSLIGSSSRDFWTVGIRALTNGNYVVATPEWSNNGLAKAGAVTWGSGTSGAVGLISASRSMVGDKAFDLVGMNVVALTNGNYVILSDRWRNAAAPNAGAVTWGNGGVGSHGVVGSANSLIGSMDGDQIGFTDSHPGVVPLMNGNYVVVSSEWNDGVSADVGAVTWGNGTAGTTGVVSSSNSLVGDQNSDRVGSSGATPLANGNYVVGSATWDDGSLVNVGAVTWADGDTGISGVVGTGNSLTGSTAFDLVGQRGVSVLVNGNYVVRSPNWDDGSTADVGAATWRDGSQSTAGAISAANSLIGSSVGDQVGLDSIALDNGNYVVCSYQWNRAAVVDAGAVTWGDGGSGTSGAVSVDNSLTGSHTADQVGTGCAISLSTGHYVVRSIYWDNGAAADAGAITWGDGLSGRSGEVDPSNSLVGSSTNDQVGSGGIVELDNGDYVVSSGQWDNAGIVNAGAVTWSDGDIGRVGPVSALNSIVGAHEMDSVGYAKALDRGLFLIYSPSWANQFGERVGAVMLARASDQPAGPLTSTNGVALGNFPFSPVPATTFAFDSAREQLSIARPSRNSVWILAAWLFRDSFN